ncbi:hypothetical protein [Streptomyces sp. NPDC000931]|uniref:hypothetical protein n=1 Tax=Streptomyces sp. NPDC000931 TaxID=3154372 RepID=UPI00332C43B1
MAMLLRRLARVVGVSAEGRPLGSICPVVTSATLGSSGGTEAREWTDASGPDGTEGGPGGPRAMLDVAWQVFWAWFPDDVVIGEERKPLEDFSPRSTCPCPCRRWTSRRLLGHPLTHVLPKTDPARPLSTAETLAGFDATSPGRAAVVREPETAAAALARFVALISEARRSSAAASGAFARSWLGRFTRWCARTAYPPVTTRG